MIRYLLFSLLLSISYSSQAQSLMIGTGGSYGSDIQQIAPNFRLYYGLNEQLCFGPEFSYFPPIVHRDASIQLSEYGFVVHYIFELKEIVGVYPLLGINYSVEKSTHSEISETENAFGLSIGGGIHFAWKNFLPFAEYKFITGDFSQSTLSIGVIYNFRLEQENEE